VTDTTPSEQPESGSADIDRREATSRGQDEALQALVNFVREHGPAYIDEDPLDLLLMFTTMRSCNTALAISNLLVTDSIEQAQMLCRALFEDMVAAHWLVMQEDPRYLLGRFYGQQEAIILREHEHVTGTMGLPYLHPELEHALERREALKAGFGRYAERAWWEARPDGSRINMAGVVGQLRTFDGYAPRFHGGDEPALQNTYALANMWANQQLHHTPYGLPFALTRTGARSRDRLLARRVTAHTAYWTFGQTIYLQLHVGTRDESLAAQFDTLFSETLRDCFAEGMSRQETRERLADLRRATKRWREREREREEA
jgi:hypothetical protein